MYPKHSFFLALEQNLAAFNTIISTVSIIENYVDYRLFGLLQA